VFLAGLHRAERGIAERLLRLAQGPPPWPAVDVDKACPWVERGPGSPWPRASARRSGWRCARRCWWSPAAGGGQDHARELDPEGAGRQGVEVALAAPTGRAAKRLGESTGWVPARSTACSRPTRGPADSSGTRPTRSAATCWSWTRPAWSTCR
jgi:exodeoxyribonuclease V alpha subunit